jgi:hypothetical protein
MASKIVVIPDGHAMATQNNERWTLAGKLIHDLRPETVVNIGDTFDFPSLCFHSKKAELEGARYQADVDAGIEAQDRLLHELRRHKKKLPRMVNCLGNHDIRPDRFVEENPLFKGKISVKDCAFDDYWDETYPFLEAVEIEGIDFLHYATSGLMGRPIGGTHPAWSIIKKRNKSTVVGHSHVLDYKVDNTPGRSLMGLSVGCFVDFHAGFAGPANDMWSRGIAILHDAEDGLFDLEWVSMKRLKDEYGN